MPLYSKVPSLQALYQLIELQIKHLIKFLLVAPVKQRKGGPVDKNSRL